MDEIMKEIGYSQGDGIQIPLVNEENKALELEILRRLQEKRKLTFELEDLNNQVKDLIKHEQCLVSEHEQNQELLAARHSQLQGEENVLLIAQAAEKILQQDIRCINKQIKDINKRNESFQKEIQKCKDKIDNLKIKMEIDKDTLMKWDEEVAKDEETNNLIQRYSCEDNNKVKECDLKRQRIKMELEERRQLLAESVKETAVLEQVLERTARLFKKLHVERQETIKQWEESVRILHQRDNDINDKVEEISMMRLHAKQRIEEMHEKKEFYETQAKNNREMELEITHILQNKSKLDIELKNIQVMNQNRESDIKVMKHRLISAGNELDHQRITTKQLSRTIIAKEKKVLKLKEEITELKTRQTYVNEHSMSTLDRLKQLEEMMQIEKKTMSFLDIDIKRLQNLLFKSEQELMALKNEESLQMVQMTGCESAKLMLGNQADNLNKELLRQQEIIYTLDFKAQTLEGKIAHVSGNQGTEQKREYEKEIFELEKVLKTKTATKNLLTSQISSLEEMMHRLSTALSNDGQELQNLKMQLKDRILLVEGGEKELKSRQLLNQERQVEENLLKLNIKRASNAIKMEADKAYNSERQKLEHDLSMKERLVEIEATKDYLLTQKRRLIEDRSCLISEIQEHLVKIEQLQKRYEILASSLGRDEEGEPLSISYFILHNIQEKHCLQHEKDALDAKIQRAEKEITAMENSLKVVRHANENYKKRLQPLKEDSSECKEKQALERKYGETIDKLKLLRIEMKDCKRNDEEMQNNLQEINVKHETLLKYFEIKEPEIQKLEKEKDDQHLKIQRVNQQIKKLIHQIKENSTIKSFPLQEKDIETRILRQKHDAILRHLALIVELHPETESVVKKYLTDHNLSLPVVSSSSLSSRSSSSSINTIEHRRCSNKLSFSSGSSSTLNSQQSLSSTVSVLTLDFNSST